MHAEGRSCVTLILPTVEDAHAAARFAVSELGGYHTALVTEASGEAPTHNTWEEWAYER